MTLNLEGLKDLFFCFTQIFSLFQFTMLTSYFSFLILTASFADPMLCFFGLSSLESGPVTASKGRIYHETYGCQMNVNDMEIVLSIMKNEGYDEIVPDPESAEIIFINTCAIRDNAEQKVWQRLNYFWFLKRQWKANVAAGRSRSLRPPKIAVLGCMAERLKEKILDSDKMVDVVCGPDAYRDLPRLLQEVDYGQKGINTLLSLEETYADITPVRISDNSVTAFVSIMRGCNNMCSFCIVPFTRGRERSRPVSSIVREVGELWKAGVKEVMLLGQNVNSYNDTSEVEELEPGKNWELSEGFSSMCKVKNMGLRFADLLDQLSLEYPEMRFRFTSPHPKDYPDELLYLMRDRHNVCKLIHMPAQSGSSAVLERMRRGYTREAYLELVQKIRSIIPDVGLSSDFISGRSLFRDHHCMTLWSIFYLFPAFQSCNIFYKVLAMWIFISCLAASRKGDKPYMS